MTEQQQEQPIKRIKLTLQAYHYQYNLPAVVSHHQIWIEGYDQQATSIQPTSDHIPRLYYRVTFVDNSTVLLYRYHQCEVAILPGVITNRTK